MEANAALTERLKQQAVKLGADLIGVAPVSRYEHAPPLLSPQGHWPGSRNVVVVATHHTDGAVEMGGRPSPHDCGPYNVQGTMNTRNERIAWHLAQFLERAGWRAMPMPATNIWRFRPYGEVTREFVPDISNIHAAAAAGLGEIGWSGLLLTPEFGPRQRFCTLLTDAPLAATPLYDGPPLCDRCLMCAKHCMTQAFDKEVDGECVVRIEDKVMRYANKSMWRCSWAEHFGLDLDLPKPDHITEEAIVEALAKHGRRGGEMGSCLRFCLPPQLRHFDRDYTDTVRRRVRTGADDKPVDRPATWEAQSIAFAWGADAVAVADAEACAAAGLELTPKLTDGQSLLAFALHWPEGRGDAGAAAAALGDTRQFIEMDLARAIERRGYAAIPCTGVSAHAAVQATGLGTVADGKVCVEPHGTRVVVGTVIASAPLEPGRAVRPEPVGADAWELLQSAAGQRLTRTGAAGHPLFDALPGDVQLVGVAPAGRLDAVAGQLNQALQLDAMAVNVVDTGGTHGAVKPRSEPRVQPIIKRPADWLAGARCVVVLGCAVPQATIERATEPPADAAGPYAYATYQARRELRHAALRVALALEAGGHRAAVADDLMGTASVVANPRGRQPDAFASRFAAVAAGLGKLLHTGAVWAPPFDTRARFIAVVTDAPLAPTPLLAEAPPCATCPRPCVAACPVAALGQDTLSVEMDGQTLSFGSLDWLRCDWAKKYALVGAEGPQWMGSRTDTAPPDRPITEADIVASYAALDPVQKHWMCIVEPCLRACALTLGGDKDA